MKQPISDTEHVRYIYVGKLQLDSGSDGVKKRTVYDMMGDIWKKASVFNKANSISGRLAWTESLHVVQLVEGRKEVLVPLMERIRKDPRLIIDKEFRKDMQVNNTGWDMSMCYFFDDPAKLPAFKEYSDCSLEELCDRVGDAFEAKRDESGVQQFYKTNIHTILMKYISLDPDTKANSNKNGSGNACVLL